MTALESPIAPSSCSQAFAVVPMAVARAARWLADAWRHRHDAAVLAAFDDRMLADIGLTRADLNDALAQPRWRDPTIVLAYRHRERRRARRPVTGELIRRASPPLVPGTDTFAFPPRDPPARL